MKNSLNKTTFIINIRLMILVYSFFFINNDGFTQWQQISNGLNHAIVNSLLIKGSDVYAGTYYTIYKSTNYGISWELTPIKNRVTVSLGTDESNIFAGTIGYGIYKSSNNGLNWIQTSINYGKVYSFANSGNVVYAGFLYSNGMPVIKKSTDGGNNWYDVLSGTPINLNSIVTSGSYVYASNYYGLSVSSDYGATWIQINMNIDIRGLCYKNNYLIEGATNNGILISSNNGYNWMQIANTSGIYANSIASNSGTIFAGGSSIYSSTDNGFHWINLLNTFMTFNRITCNDDIVLAVGAGVFASTNNGSNWAYRNTGFKDAQVTFIDTFNNKLYTGGSFAGLYCSEDNGNNWFNTGSFIYQVRSFTHFGNNLIAGTLQGIWLSTDLGITWERKGLDYYVINEFFIDGNNIISGSGDGIFISTNGGYNWSNTNIIDEVYSICKKGTKLFAGTNTGLYYSTNGGYNWSLTSLTNYSTCTSVSGNLIYAGTNDSGLYKSTNDGQSWIKTLLNIQSINSVLAFDNIVIASGDVYTHGIYISTNEGQSWYDKSNNLPTTTFFCFLIKDNIVYTGTDYEGIWKRNLSELIGVRNISEEIPSSYKLFQNYPNPFNPVTKIKFSITEQSIIKLEIFDVSGKLVQLLVDKKMQVGTYETDWDASSMPSGTYFCRMSNEKFSKTIKLILLK